MTDDITIKQRAELIAAGWKEKIGSTVWQCPKGTLFVGPAGAWKVMQQRLASEAKVPAVRSR